MPLHNPPSVLKGSGPPVSGSGGTIAPAGATYLDTAQTPRVPYMQLADDMTNPSWIQQQTGNTT